MHKTPEAEPQDDDLSRAREVLERTKRFLAHCAQDPTAAMAAEDPRDLIRGLESLSVQPKPTVAPQTVAPPTVAQPTEEQPLKEPRTIQIHRRRSA